MTMTQGEYEEIKKNPWGKDGPARLLEEVERLHPDWVEPRWRVTCTKPNGVVNDNGLTLNLKGVIEHLECNTNNAWVHTFQRVRL